MSVAVADLEAAVGQDCVARGGLLADVAALRVALAPGDEDGAGVNDLRPPAVIGIAFVEDVGGALFQRDGAASPATIWRRLVNPASCANSKLFRCRSQARRCRRTPRRDPRHAPPRRGPSPD